MLAQPDRRRAAELVAQVQRRLQQRLVEHAGQGTDLLPEQVIAAAKVAGLPGDEALTGVTPAPLLKIALGKHPLAVVVAQHAVGVGDHFAAGVVVAVQRATAQGHGDRQREVVEQ